MNMPVSVENFTQECFENGLAEFEKLPTKIKENIRKKYAYLGNDAARTIAFATYNAVSAKNDCAYFVRCFIDLVTNAKYNLVTAHVANETYFKPLLNVSIISKPQKDVKALAHQLAQRFFGDEYDKTTTAMKDAKEEKERRKAAAQPHKEALNHFYGVGSDFLDNIIKYMKEFDLYIEEIPSGKAVKYKFTNGHGVSPVC